MSNIPNRINDIKLQLIETVKEGHFESFCWGLTAQIVYYHSVTMPDALQLLDDEQEDVIEYYLADYNSVEAYDVMFVL